MAKWQSIRFAVSTGRMILILGIALIASGCTWKPRVWSPEVCSSGKVLEKGKVDAAVQVVPAGQVACGLGKGTEIRGMFGAMGDDIVGGDITLAKSVRKSALVFSNVSLSGGGFKANEHDFDGYRLSAGWTTSVYTRNGLFAVHLPFRVHWTHYHWSGFKEYLWLNQTGPWIDVRNDGVYGVLGLALSVQGEHLSLRWGFNTPLHDRVGAIELLPTAALQLGVRF